ncbi:hypothetical protein T552_01307 [Pneumocystis carinii B80]|uniref:Actin cytoskeleton-regulatory complex protein SLA1 n=1 Tax=Pneumocystis carinii (strain B80) TaxID=1408658 RepID=A0A0W4ZLV0_PNEC8|nr:hypothetical protein T552_01307 [Pneumocystis carinii B80]KTW29353.1 hypothetical protein T552_01307 [Pneumocystis carinii B80]
MAEDRPFIGIYRSLYPYQPQQDPEYVVAENKELELEENELLYILEKGEDLWWRVKKKAMSEQEDGDVGLVPGNYLEECQPIYQVRTLYDYEQQSYEEISFNEGEILDVFDEEGENWVFARCGISYGFAPSNYLEKIINTRISEDKSNVIQEDRGEKFSPTSSHISVESMKKTEVSKEIYPSLQNIQVTNKLKKKVATSSEKPIKNKELSNSETLDAYVISNEPYSFNTQDNFNGNFKTWTVHEIDKKKRRKGILGVGDNKITFSSESGKKSPQIFPISSIIQYSVEKKHVFIDVSSSKSTISYDFHAGSSETAAEIYSAIENLASICRSTLKEITSVVGTVAPTMHMDSGTIKEIEKTSYKGDKSANNNDNNDNNITNRFNSEELEEKKGLILYDFDAVEDDEISVKENMEVFILDDTSNNDWWKVRKGDQEGLVPASYIRYFPQNLKILRNQKSVKDSKELKDPKKTEYYQNELQKSEKKVHVEKKTNKPQSDKIRTWTDRTGSFKVDARFLGIIDNKIHLHKLNGVKISVPMSKMSLEDIHYVESITEPFKNKRNTTTNSEVSDNKQSKTKNKTSLNKHNSSTSASKNDYDWFDFFLSSGVKHELCQTYATNFENENLVKLNLLDLTREDMQKLGIRDDDIIRITKYIREKFKNKLDVQDPKPEINKPESQINSETENLNISKEDKLDSLLSFSNEKSKSLQVNDKTDTHSFSKSINKESLSETKKTSTSGFEDDAWSIRSSNIKKTEPSILPNSETTNPQLAYAIKNLSLLTPPMKPTHTSPISTQFSKQQIQQNSLPQAQPISQTTIQTQYTAVDPFPATFTDINSNTSHLQPYQNYRTTNIPAASRYFSMPAIQPTIPQFQYQQTLQPQIGFDQKTKQQIPHNSPYINPQLSTNQTQIYNMLPFTQQNTTSLPSHIQNNGYNNPMPQHTTIQQPFQNSNIFRHSVTSQYSNYNQPTLFLQNTYQPSIQQQDPSNNFASSNTLKYIPNNSAFSTTSQPPNTSFKQTPTFKPVQFGTSKSSRPESIEKRANIDAATPQNPFGF